MDASLWVAKTGLNAQQTRMSVISNNLANVNTTGFKRDRPVLRTFSIRISVSLEVKLALTLMRLLVLCWVRELGLCRRKKFRAKAI